MKVHTIDLKFQGYDRAIAAYLVEGPSGHLLIETGPESTLPCLLDHLTGFGLRPEDLTAVLVTHIHLDHAGAAGWFASRGVPVYVHEKGARHLVSPERLLQSARTVYGDRFEPLWGGMTPAPAGKVIPLADGETRPLAGLPVEALSTPGHAFHHHAFFLEDTAFVGDAAGAVADGCSYLSVTSAPPQFDLEHTLASLEKIQSRSPRLLYPTHFGVITDPPLHLCRYAEAVRENATWIAENLRHNPDEAALQDAYRTHQHNKAREAGCDEPTWEMLQTVNGTSMCADGIRQYWEKKWATES